jgi:hypothetical protein
MSVPRISLEELSDRFDAMTSLASRSAAIGVTDTDAAAYARVLEYGSVAGQRPWPRPRERTIAAVDPETGTHVVVSAQAPQGFIRVHAPEFLEKLREALSGVANWLDADELDRHFSAAVQASAEQTLDSLRGAVPRDSGRLEQSLIIVKS